MSSYILKYLFSSPLIWISFFTSPSWIVQSFTTHNKWYHQLEIFSKPESSLGHQIFDHQTLLVPLSTGISHFGRDDLFRRSEVHRPFLKRRGPLCEKKNWGTLRLVQPRPRHFHSLLVGQWAKICGTLFLLSIWFGRREMQSWKEFGLYYDDTDSHYSC